MMKKLLVLGLVFYQSLVACEWDYHDNSEHFTLFCAQGDAVIAQEFLSSAEDTYAQMSALFCHTIDRKIQIDVFPDVAAFHEAQGVTNAPDYFVASGSGDMIQLVSPLNSSVCHLEQRIRKILCLKVVQAFIWDQFDAKNLPNWLVFGVAANKSGYWPKANCCNSCCRKDSFVPKIKTMEILDRADFREKEMFLSGYRLATYIESTYGWEKMLQLLSNYQSFEEIIGAPKETVYKNWLNSL